MPRRAMASARPMDVVVLPSPALVGVMAVTRISLPRAGPAGWAILALYEP